MSMSSNAGTTLSYKRLVAAQPVFSSITRLRDLIPSFPERGLLHAGPPFRSTRSLPQPVINAAVAAAMIEGYAETEEAARHAIEQGDIKLFPAQNFNVVTPLAFIAGPSIWAVVIRDEASPGLFKCSPLNDGPPTGCLRFGVNDAAGKTLLSALTRSIGAEISEAFQGPVEMLPILRAALHDGDELHGQVAAANTRIRSVFSAPLSKDTEAYFDAAGQFALNVIMATCALMLEAGKGVDQSDMVVACGGNGQQIGYKLSARPNDWITLPASRPKGPKIPGKEAASSLPAIGDSAVIDAVGFGAACLRFAPSLQKPLAGFTSDAYGSDAAHDPFIGSHPALDLSGLKVGLDLNRSRKCLGIMLGMVEETGKEGLIGRGVAPWPEV